MKLASDRVPTTFIVRLLIDYDGLYSFRFTDWLPNHVMVMMIVIVFTILNPLVIPFSLIYFSAAAGE